jgi:hypothetical protein
MKIINRTASHIKFLKESEQRNEDAIKAVYTTDPLTYAERARLRTYLADASVIRSIIEQELDEHREERKNRFKFWKK